MWGVEGGFGIGGGQKDNNPDDAHDFGPLQSPATHNTSHCGDCEQFSPPTGLPRRIRKATNEQGSPEVVWIFTEADDHSDTASSPFHWNGAATHVEARFLGKFRVFQVDVKDGSWGFLWLF